MRKDSQLHIKIEFEEIPILDGNFIGMNQAEKAWREVRKKLK